MGLNKISLKEMVRRLPLLILFPVFFILHGYNENFGLISSGIIVKLFLKYITITLFFLVISILFLRNITKAVLFSLFLLGIFFFFGAFYDLVKKMALPGIFTSYKLFLPLVFVFGGSVFLLFLKSKRNFDMTLRYCSYLLVIMTVLETGSFAIKYFSNKSFNDLSSEPLEIKPLADSCLATQKPDIFFIILDGYTSSKCLQEEFTFSNKAIDSLLRSNQFFISVDSKSNYNVTPFSLSSTLDMNYLKPGIENGTGNENLIFQAIATLKKNKLSEFLKKEGYQIKNFGCFDFSDASTPTRPYFDEFYYREIDDQTLYSRVLRDIGWNITTKNLFTGSFRIPKGYTRAKEYHIYRNQFNWEKLMNEIKQKSDSPRFVYAHIMLPHEPFYLDKDGSMVSDTAIILKDFDFKTSYFNQLLYTNRLLADFIPLVSKKAKRERVVMIQGDHGFRDYGPNVSLEKEFMNLNAYYFSDHNYSMLYDSISPVNSFRVILNKYFCQSFPLLKDSTIFLWH